MADRDATRTELEDQRGHPLIPRIFSEKKPALVDDDNIGLYNIEIK